MPKSPIFKLLFFMGFPLFAAEPQTGVQIQVDENAFKSYWYQGKAEISRYQLKQARYGELHEGDAVMIFVTEDFLAEKQVKHEFGNEEADPILKLNATRKFNTGLYPYSLMTSTFTKVDFAQPETAKVTFSGQEWCGHVFMQVNRRAKHFQIQHFSYFQAEGDKQKTQPLIPLEDDVWTQIRIAPNQLPNGELQMLPSLLYSRLLHKPYKPFTVQATLEEVSSSDISPSDAYRYTLHYTELGRKLEIYFGKQAPYKILGWKETYRSGFGAQASTLETTAIKTHEISSAYWSKNKNQHRSLRRELGLE